MPNIFDDPEVKAAMAAAGVVHKSGVAQEMLRDLEPFLAEEGVDLDDLGDTDLDTINAALGRATARYNATRPDPSPVRQLPSDSPFVKRPPAQPAVSGVRDISSAPSNRASRRKAKHGRHVSGHPGRRKRAAAGGVLVRQFDSWLREQEQIAAPSPELESGMFGNLLEAARRQGLDLHTPTGVLDLVDLFLEAEGDEEDDPTTAALTTLHDYLHFRMETADDPAAWEEAHDNFHESVDEEPLPGLDVLQAAMADADQLDPDERRAAFAQTTLVAKVTDLLDWIGSGRRVSPSGALRRVDIAHAASLLGVDAIGVNKLPDDVPDGRPLIKLDDPSPRSATLQVLAMQNVPLLPSWWEILIVAQLIETNTYRVTPGPAAAEWVAEALPPVDTAELVIGMTVARFLCEDMTNRVYFAERATAIMVSLLLRALAPEEVPPPTYEDEWDRLLTQRVIHDLERLVRVGVLTRDDQGEFSVPTALRGAVARGIASGLAILSGAFEPE